MQAEVGGEEVEHCLGCQGENRSKERRTINTDEFKYSLNPHNSSEIEKAHIRPGPTYQSAILFSAYRKRVMIPAPRQAESWRPRSSPMKHTQMHTHPHMHTQANSEHAHTHSMTGKCSELHLASQES